MSDEKTAGSPAGPGTATGAGPSGADVPESGLRLSPHLLKLGPQAVAQVVDRFLTNVADVEREIGDAVEGGDAATLERAAHSLKGSSGTIGAFRLREICRRLEELAGRGSVAGAEEGLAELRREHRQIRRDLRRYAGTRG